MIESVLNPFSHQVSAESFSAKTIEAFGCAAIPGYGMQMLFTVPRERVGDETSSGLGRESEFFVDNLLVRIHLIIEIILVDRPYAMEARIPFSS